MGTLEWRDLRFDPATRTLTRDGVPVPLGGQESIALALLAEAEGEPVSNETLFRELWPDKKVSNSSLTQVIHKLRRALQPDGDLVVVNVARVGYRTGVVWQPAGEPASPVVTPPRRTFPRRGLIGGLTVAAGGVILILAKALRPTGAGPRVLRYNQLTHDGLPKFGTVVGDGSRLYYTDASAGSRVVSIPNAGGEPTPLRLDGLPSIYDFAYPSPGLNSVVLTVRGSDGNTGWLWQPGSAKATRLDVPLDDLVAQDPSGTVTARRRGRTLTISRQGGALRTFEMTGKIGNGIWSPNGSFFRCSVSDGDNFSYWDVPVQGGEPRMVRRTDGSPARNLDDGAWSREGKFFIFRDHSGGEENRGLQWARELGGSVISDPQALTDGSLLSWTNPTPAPDGRSIYAFGNLTRTELVRFDKGGLRNEPYLNGIPAMELDYSRDGRSTVYTRYSDHTLWLAGPGRAEAKQLTTTEFDARMGHFSPDGKWIAFMGQRKGGPWRIYRIPAMPDGGQPEPVADSSEPQGVPTWSGDGKRIAFGERLNPAKEGPLRIRIIDVDSRKIGSLPDSDGLWTARWSPDGCHIAALTTDSRSLVVFDVAKGTRREIARFPSIGNPMWGADSRWIYAEATELPEGRAIYRVDLTGAKQERLVDLSKFRTYGERWFGVTPDGDIIGTHSVFVSDLYALECEFPG